MVVLSTDAVRDIPGGARSVCDGATVAGDTTRRTVNIISTLRRVLSLIELLNESQIRHSCQLI